ncbi:bifunctional uridylyltransferase/uridylyl-removing enzyme [Desulfuromonas versatilis]|uniref:Bifunctional uridylyltransferase/uridylyl-removing enzyme n=1 Tax=Desulfuromonas versatilis TaxID=2802975 RepID=A0ABN6DXR0_9BACT|nr:[protein-PII] uridylyltransferase [Desulfuromonas versatilis]BCR04810.1 bifunctional uridylyltransferase/uridylyl-removing enzyme [Desulfuromonas versatilis]
MNLDDKRHTEPFFSRELLTDPAMPYEERRRLLLEGGRAYLQHHREAIREKHRKGASGRQIVGSLTSLSDTLIRNLYRSVSADIPPEGQGACALIALGGYGRGELNPYSDIDLMFYYPGKDKSFAELISERMLYLLWDLGLEVGYSVRTDRDCLEMAERDITARTALLDSRLLVGDETLYQAYEKAVLGPVIGKNSQGFIREKLEENQRRLRKYGSSVYLLEPNIKEGEGGLRDLHTGLWVCQVKFKARKLRDLVIKGVMTEEEAKDYEDALDYLWRIRNELHFLSPRKNDQIYFDMQEKIARFLGFKDNRKALAVEQFMQDFYSQALKIEHVAASMVSKATQQDEPTFRVLGYLTRRTVEEGFYILRGELRASRKDLFVTDPERIMRAFVLAQRHEVALAVSVKGMIRESLHLINDKVRRSRLMTEGFLEILRTPKGMAQALREMHHLQVLNRFIPEFGRIYCKVQHDAYHIYTVDTHSLFAVEEIAKLWRGEYREKKPLLTQVANDIEKRALLLLAVLFHDIGKGEGKDHSNKGADLIPTIARRLGLNREDSQRLEFLVRNHLVMAHIAQRRDLHDEKLIIQFARTMGMSENLKMLYLLTFADIKAVGPDVWTEWKGFLLQELYEKAYQVLERGNFQLEQRSEKVRNRKRKVVELLEEEFGLRPVKEQVKAMSTRYLLSYRSATIADHLRLVFSRQDRTLATRIEHEPEGKYTQVTITTLDVPGLFAKIAGVMAANGINVLGAQINTLSNGVALDVLQVTGSTGEILDKAAKWKRVEEDLTAVIEGRVQVEDLVAKRHRPSFLVERPKPRFPNRVELDNEVSEEYTVIDIYAHDKVGLLYSICQTFKELGLYIGVSKISTKVDQAADTFYVQDIFGQKILKQERMEEIRSQLLAAISDEENAG